MSRTFTNVKMYFTFVNRMGLDEISKRFELVMNHYGYTKGAFAQKLGVSQGVISHISSGRNKPGLDMVASLLSSHPEIDPDWLIQGKGSMKRPLNKGLNELDHILKSLHEVKLVNEMSNKSIDKKIKEIEFLIDKMR